MRLNTDRKCSFHAKYVYRKYIYRTIVNTEVNPNASTFNLNQGVMCLMRRGWNTRECCFHVKYPHYKEYRKL